MKIEVLNKRTGRIEDSFDAVRTAGGIFAEDRLGKWVLIKNDFESVKNYLESVNGREFGFNPDEVAIEFIED